MSAVASKERLMTIVLGPHVSEKSSRIAEASNQIVFRVRRDATRVEVRRAVELMFDVKVDAVQVANVRGKVKRFGSTLGRRADWKKAYVTLSEGHDIDFLGAE